MRHLAIGLILMPCACAQEPVVADLPQDWSNDDYATVLSFCTEVLTNGSACPGLIQAARDSYRCSPEGVVRIIGTVEGNADALSSDLETIRGPAWQEFDALVSELVAAGECLGVVEDGSE